jgi:hypothetical protein
MIKLGDAVLMLNTAYEDGERPPVPEPARVRGHQDVSLYFEFSDLERTDIDDQIKTRRSS